ncbi:hypothetical protein EQG49_03905 [Periweissella cryptocerci]|uniref:Uncharacterized protein n=1 Tax=Periweissella cryptocerci TaxID=2506420 RepID=A0A4P6YSP3_9LACO|nr:hypothetical protein [Periweissella cryptocerci]QBO35662.1 hypothetical protein EQG49_03905 [Periweissella cryptocerci]
MNTQQMIERYVHAATRYFWGRRKVAAIRTLRNEILSGVPDSNDKAKVMTRLHDLGSPILWQTTYEHETGFLAKSGLNNIYWYCLRLLLVLGVVVSLGLAVVEAFYRVNNLPFLMVTGDILQHFGTNLLLWMAVLTSILTVAGIIFQWRGLRLTDVVHRDKPWTAMQLRTVDLPGDGRIPKWHSIVGLVVDGTLLVTFFIIAQSLHFNNGGTSIHIFSWEHVAPLRGLLIGAIGFSVIAHALALVLRHWSNGLMLLATGSQILSAVFFGSILLDTANWHPELIDFLQQLFKLNPTEIMERMEMFGTWSVVGIMLLVIYLITQQFLQVRIWKRFTSILDN